jgi:CheY-like chemotaxis protein
MDIVMPDMDGIEATKRILAEFPKALIVMVTTVAKALAAGANGYVRHPIDRIELAEVLNNSRRYRARMDRGNLIWERGLTAAIW